MKKWEGCLVYCSPALHLFSRTMVLPVALESQPKQAEHDSWSENVYQRIVLKFRKTTLTDVRGWMLLRQHYSIHIQCFPSHASSKTHPLFIPAPSMRADSLFISVEVSAFFSFLIPILFTTKAFPRRGSPFWVHCLSILRVTLSVEHLTDAVLLEFSFGPHGRLFIQHNSSWGIAFGQWSIFENTDGIL